MKFRCCVLVLLYVLHGAVCDEIELEDAVTLIEPLPNGFIKAGKPQEIKCKGSTKHEKVEWLYPSGEPVKPSPSSRVSVKTFLAKSPRPSVRVPKQVLSFKQVKIEDSGVWKCQSGDIWESISICVIDPSEFVDTPTEVTIDKGRSISLTCQVKGDPEPQIEWKRNGEIISGDDSSSKYKAVRKYKTQGYESFITIVAMEPEDSGVYTCVATQENPLADDCTTSTSLDVTLNINYGPIFEDNNSVNNFVYGRNNESIDLECAANSFPPATYRWFHELGEVFSEIPQKQFNLSENSSLTTLSLIANASTFGDRYSCRASNVYGDAFKYFTVLELKKPKTPSEVLVSNFTTNQIEFNITWDTDITPFPVKSFKIQYLEKSGGGTPRNFQWKTANEISIDFDPNHLIFEDVYITLPNLNENTEYWIRVRATNDGGESSWSSPILAYTDELDEGTPMSITENEMPVLDNDAAMFYGIMFAGGVVVLAVVSTLVASLL